VADGEAGSLRWAYLASAAIALLTVFTGIAAVYLTPGTPHCWMPSALGRVLLCPWYRRFAWNAAVIAAAFLLVAVLVSAVVGFGRAILGASWWFGTGRDGDDRE
jgi:hypothetical protein